MTTMPKDFDKEIVFGVMQPNGDTPAPVTVFCGVPRACYDDMITNQARTKNFDLTALGLPFRLIMFAAESYEKAKDVLEQAAAQLNLPLDYRTRDDFSIAQPANDAEPPQPKTD
jgi:hypothetical protein